MVECFGPGSGGRAGSVCGPSLAQPVQHQPKCLWQPTTQLLTVIRHHRGWATPRRGEGPPEGSALDTKTAFTSFAVSSVLHHVSSWHPHTPTNTYLHHFICCAYSFSNMALFIWPWNCEESALPTIQAADADELNKNAFVKDKCEGVSFMKDYCRTCTYIQSAVKHSQGIYCLIGFRLPKECCP